MISTSEHFMNQTSFIINWYDIGPTRCRTSVYAGDPYRQIVDKSSAVLNLRNEIATPISATNHRTICKFPAEDPQTYLPVARAISEIAGKALVQHNAALTGEAAGTPDQGRLRTTDSHTIKAGMFEYGLRVADHLQAILAGGTQTVRGSRNIRIPQTGSDIKTYKLSEPYLEPARVLIGISHLDVDFRQSLRAHASVSEVTPISFRPVLETWGDTICHGIYGSWLEIAPGDSDIQTGRCNTYGLDKASTDAEDMKIIRDVEFYNPYAEIPGVVCYLVHIDSLHFTNHRMHVIPHNITRTGFELHFASWGDSRIYELEAEWIAFSKDRKDMYAFPEKVVMHPRPGNIVFRFPEKNFKSPPACFVTLSKMDIISGRDVRVKITVHDVTKTFASVSVDTWDNSHNWAIGVTGMAVL